MGLLLGLRLLRDPKKSARPMSRNCRSASSISPKTRHDLKDFESMTPRTSKDSFDCQDQLNQLQPDLGDENR